MTQHDPYQVRTQSKPAISNAVIMIVAIASFGGLSSVLAMFLGFDAFSKKVETEIQLQSEEVVEEEPLTPTEQTIQLSGYEFQLPIGYQLLSNEKTETGDVVVRYQGEENCHFIFAILEDPNWDRFTSPPAAYEDAVIPSIKGLDYELDAELLAQRVGVGGMPASLFQFYERETFRGIEFTYLLVAMHRGQKVVLKFGGKYKRYKEDVEFVEMPEHWRRYLMTLRPLLPNEVID